MNIVAGDNSLAIGERNVVLGHHSIIIGKDLKTEENYKLIVKFNPTCLGFTSDLMPEINIDETISEREYNLISSTLKAILYLDEQKRINGIKDFGSTSMSYLNVPGMKNCDCKEYCNENTCIGRRV